MSGLDGLERASLLFVMAGLGAMYAAATVYSPPDVSPGAIGMDDVGTTVAVTGRVSDLQRTEDGVFFDIEGDGGEMRGVSFRDVNVREGERYRLTGQIDVYRGELEIVVEAVDGIGPPDPG